MPAKGIGSLPNPADFLSWLAGLSWDLRTWERFFAAQDGQSPLSWCNAQKWKCSN